MTEASNRQLSAGFAICFSSAAMTWSSADWWVCGKTANAYKTMPIGMLNTYVLSLRLGFSSLRLGKRITNKLFNFSSAPEAEGRLC